MQHVGQRNTHIEAPSCTAFISAESASKLLLVIMDYFPALPNTALISYSCDLWQLHKWVPPPRAGISSQCIHCHDITPGLASPSLRQRQGMTDLFCGSPRRMWSFQMQRHQCHGFQLCNADTEWHTKTASWQLLQTFQVAAGDCYVVYRGVLQAGMYY